MRRKCLVAAFSLVLVICIGSCSNSPSTSTCADGYSKAARQLQRDYDVIKLTDVNGKIDPLKRFDQTIANLSCPSDIEVLLEELIVVDGKIVSAFSEMAIQLAVPNGSTQPAGQKFSAANDEKNGIVSRIRSRLGLPLDENSWRW